MVTQLSATKGSLAPRTAKKGQGTITLPGRLRKRVQGAPAATARPPHIRTRRSPRPAKLLAVIA